MLQSGVLKFTAMLADVLTAVDKENSIEVSNGHKRIRRRTQTVFDLHFYCANPFADERERDITLWIREVDQ